MTEQTLILGPDRHLVATITPIKPGVAPAGWMAVLTNSGVIGRAGPHRMNVRLARQFAEMGIPSIRFDMSGLGDSKRASGTLPQTEQWVADTRTIMDAAQAHFGPLRFFMIGYCSGAEVAHLTALKDKRLRAAVLWDFYAFPTSKVRWYKLLHRLRRTGLQGLVGKVWRKLTGAGPTASSSPANERAPSVYDGPKTPREVYIGRFNELAQQDVEMFFYYSGGEPDWFAYRDQFKDMFGDQPFYKRVTFDQLYISDHLITGKAAQEGFAKAVHQWLRQQVLNKR